MRDFFKKIFYLYKNLFYLLGGLIIYVIFIGDCLIKKFTGFPCPSCGITRSALYFFKGDFKESFFYHPLFLLLVFTIAIYLLQVWFNSKSKYFNYFYIIVVSIFLITYVYRMSLLFPYSKPLDYNFDSIFYKLYKAFF